MFFYAVINKLLRQVHLVYRIKIFVHNVKVFPCNSLINLPDFQLSLQIYEIVAKETGFPLIKIFPYCHFAICR